MLGEEPLDQPVHVNEVVGVDESVPFVVLDHVFDLDAARPKGLDEIVGFGLHDTGVVGSLDDQQRPDGARGKAGPCGDVLSCALLGSRLLTSAHLSRFTIKS